MIYALALALLATSDDTTFESSRGFAIDRPEGWTVHESGANGGAYDLRFHAPGTNGLTGISIQIGPNDGAESGDAVVERSIEWTRGREEYASVEAVTVTLGDQELPGVSTRFVLMGQREFRIRQLYRVEGDRLFTLQSHAPHDEYERWSAELDRVLATFRLVAPSPDVTRRTRLQELAARCGSEVDWAPSWDAAAERARVTGRPVLVATRMQLGFDIGDTIRQVTFMDADLVALANRRFVPLVYRKGDPAPFVDADVYGIGPSGFGTAIFVCSADGEVLHELASLDPLAVHAHLVDWLMEHGDAEAPASPARGAARAEELCERGELHAALHLLEGERGARAGLVRARVHRLRSDGDAALRALEEARAALPPGDHVLAAEVAAEEFLVRMRMGDDEGARDLAERVVAEGSRATPAALFWLGVLATRAEDPSLAKHEWGRLVDGFPESRWAWRAAAELINVRFALGLAMPTEFARAGHLRELRAPAYAPIEASHAPAAEQVAVDYLVREQLEDGSWEHPAFATRGDREDGKSHPFVDAVAAIAGAALLERGREDAAERALAFVLGVHGRRAADDDPIVFMDYKTYADAWCIRFLADAIEAGLGDAGELRGSIARHVASMRTRHRANGGWSYYLSQSADPDAERLEQSISFVTALAALALQRADDVGVATGDDLLGDALACLAAMRNPNGAFEYMLMVGASASGATGLPGAAGRSPVCELALYRGDESDLERLRGALDAFVEHRHDLHAQLGKALMHCGPAGEGCHYLFFDYATAAEAVAELPDAERARYRAVLLELILDARAPDGAFRDTPLNGWAYGTAMALAALRDLRERREL